MSENRKFQLNIKFGGGYEAPLLNVEGDNAVEFQQNVKFVADNAAEIVAVATTFLAAYNVAKPSDNPPPAALPAGVSVQQGGWNAGAQTPPPQWAQGNPQEMAQQAPPQQNNEQLIPQQHCSHGPMKLQRAKPGSGRDWVAFMCPTPKGTPGQCKPVDAKTGKSWN